MVNLIARCVFPLIFTSLGTWLIWRGVRSECGAPFLTANLSGDARERLSRVLAERSDLGMLPCAFTSVALGACSIAAAALSVFATLPFIIITYSILTLLFGLAIVAETLAMRELRGRRAAALTPRSTSGPAPRYAYLLMAFGIAAPAIFVSEDWYSQLALAGLIALCAGALLGLCVACGDSQPVVLSGLDLQVEAYVESQLRRTRTLTLLCLTVAPGYVYMAFSGFHSRSELAALLVSLTAVLALNGLLFATLRREPQSADIQRWSHDG